MHHDRDLFIFLSRTGRVPPSVRAGPRHHGGVAAAGAAVGPTGSVRGAAPRRLAHRVAAAVGRRRAPRDARSGMEAYADPQAYLELEFAVGFAAEDERLS